eukprot:CAMPEP_0119036864 /NCGR_PEP_ID=MMETSP1177-20130426/4868_1 /TAXON_ID=2985 /ORGANISM="Ochromonas sp, Strain CCMP1899" /LENGTH=478 /DNA_ID=CAMNT_0006997335 /DNA_START=329 /DNA_END=1765 /DNA_ORIENTATION=-
MPTIKKSLGLTQYEVYVSNILSVLATIFMRFLVGPMCERYGPRNVMSVVLVIGSIPTFLVGLVTSFEGLCIVRFFIGTIGATFVMCQYWTTQMFTKEVVGTANAIVGGWGNLGGGVTHWLMGSALFPLFVVFTSGDTELAWRTVFIVPACLTLFVAWWSYYYSDDTPKGDLSEIRQKDSLVGQLIGAEMRDGAPSSIRAFGKALQNPNTLLLMIQYGACFGVELTMYNATASYFFQEFSLDQGKAASIAGAFGFMNICARGLGGWFSDYCNKHYSMRGRLFVQFWFLIAEGVLCIVFAMQENLGAAVATLIFFSIFVQAASGSTFGIVPYVDPKNNGAVYGAVGAGGNIGAVLWGLIFLYGSSARRSITILGYIILCSAGCCFAMKFPGYSWMLMGVDEPEKREKGNNVLLGLRGMTFEQLLDKAQGEEGVDMVEIAGGKMVKKFNSCDDLAGLSSKDLNELGEKYMGEKVEAVRIAE